MSNEKNAHRKKHSIASTVDHAPGTPAADTTVVRIVGTNSEGALVETDVKLASAAASNVLANAPDGGYGSTNTGAGTVSGVVAGDTPEAAFDKVETILEKLAPAKSPNLSAITLTIPGLYAAAIAGSNTVVTNVTDDTTPTASTSGVFADGDVGVLSATIDAVPSGSITLSTASDVGTSGALAITQDVDPYVGQVGKANFWKSLFATITSQSALSAGVQHAYVLLHSITGSANKSFYVDNPGTPTVTGIAVTTPSSGRLVSGVPCLNYNDAIQVSYTVGNAIGKFYNSTRISRIEGAALQAANVPNAANPPEASNVVVTNYTVLIANNAFDPTLDVTVRAYNSKGTSITQTLITAIRVDSKSNETLRVTSGAGQYPSTGYGSAFNSGTLLTAGGNEELQMENAIFKYPDAEDYSVGFPAGPDYSTIAAGSYANMRWATFDLGAVSSITGFTMEINGDVNFGTSTIVSGIALYARVDGAGGTLGWVDCNAAYPGVGNPKNDGDAALNVGSSDKNTKVVTFGNQVKTGTLFVRIGIPSGSNKTFTDITKTA